VRGQLGNFDGLRQDSRRGHSSSKMKGATPRFAQNYELIGKGATRGKIELSATRAKGEKTVGGEKRNEVRTSKNREGAEGRLVRVDARC